MIYGLQQLTYPTLEPVFVATLKTHLHYNGDTSEDANMGTYIIAARQFIEAQTNLCMKNQQWLYTLDEVAEVVYLPKAPVVSVDKVEYFDGSSWIETTDYTADKTTLPGRVIFENWPTISGDKPSWRITFTAGYGSNLPATLTQAVLLLAAHFFWQREATGDSQEIPYGLKAIIDTYKVHYVEH